jgi:hypothetical protein
MTGPFLKLTDDGTLYVNAQYMTSFGANTAPRGGSCIFDTDPNAPTCVRETPAQIAAALARVGVQVVDVASQGAATPVAVMEAIEAFEASCDTPQLDRMAALGRLMDAIRGAIADAGCARNTDLRKALEWLRARIRILHDDGGYFVGTMPSATDGKEFYQYLSFAADAPTVADLGRELDRL